MKEEKDLHPKLGDPVDLWAGLRPRFLPQGSAWRVPPGRPLLTQSPDIPSDPVAWAPPSLSLHESVADLLSHIFDYSVTPMVGLDGPLSITAGSLIESASLAELEQRLGMDLTTQPAPAYLLVRLTGCRGTRYYTPEWEGLNRKVRILAWLTPEGRAAMARLRLDGMRYQGTEFHGDVFARQVQRYLDYYDTMGTHLVRSIRYGEQLFQVFAVNGNLLPALRGNLAGQTDGMAYGMAHLTRAPWVTGASPILTASGRAEAQQVAHHAIWGEPCSLLSPRAMPEWSRAAVLDTLSAQAVIGASFASQALYLEDFRADAWSRIMRAGLCQRFPLARTSGWRIRTDASLADVLTSAALSGPEALSRPVAPELPTTALMLDMRGPGQLSDRPAACLGLFAATDPGTGRPAELEINVAGFDPASLTIPFLDGALCVTDRRGDRHCLVEHIWLGPGGNGRAGLSGAPTEPDAAMLIERAAQLAGWCRLMERLQGPAFPPDVPLAMRRAAAWLADVTAHRPPLLKVRWRALLAARCAQPIEPDSITLNHTLRSGLTRLLGACMDLLALPAQEARLDIAVEQADREFQAFHALLPGMSEHAELDGQSLAVGQALRRRLTGIANIPEPAATVLAIGADLSLPPDPHHMPHCAEPGDAPHALLWNAILALRACYTECRAILLAMQNRMAEAVDLLAGEIITSREATADPAGDLLAALDALCGAPIGAADRAMLLADVAQLLALHKSALLLHLARTRSFEQRPETGPQLHRLLLLLDVVQLCRAVGIPLAAIDSLAPTAFAARIDQALMAMTGDHHPA